MKRERRPKRAKKLRSINFSLWLNFTVFAVVIVLAMAIIAISVFAGTNSSQARDRLKAISSSVSDYLDTNPSAEDIDAYIYDVEKNEGVKISLIVVGEDALYPSYETDSDYIFDMLDDVTEQCAAGGGSAYIYDDSGMNYAARLGYGGGDGSYLIVHYSTQIYRNALSVIGVYLIIMVLVFILVAFVISYFISMRLAVPINGITSSAKELAKGNYDVRFASAQYTEVAELSDTMNVVKREIKKSDEYQKNLLANVSHDLKTPLTMIKAYASMIKEISGDNPAKREKGLDVIISESDRLTDMIDDVLKLSKAQSDDKLNMKVFNFTDMIYGIVNKFGYLQDVDGYSIMVDIDPDVYTRADEEKIEQVIYNLISNAINYTGEDKTIYISLKDSPADRRVKFSVRDTGMGIAKKDMEHIWDRFYRVNENHDRPVKGTGLGLSIVKVILDRHKFDFGVESEPGKGSTFWADFPSIPETEGE